MSKRLFLSQSDVVRIGAALYGANNDSAISAFYADMVEAGMIGKRSLPGNFSDWESYGLAWLRQLREQDRLAIKPRSPNWNVELA